TARIEIAADSVGVGILLAAVHGLLVFVAVAERQPAAPDVDPDAAGHEPLVWMKMDVVVPVTADGSEIPADDDGQYHQRQCGEAIAAQQSGRHAGQGSGCDLFFGHSGSVRLDSSRTLYTVTRYSAHTLLL